MVNCWCGRQSVIRTSWTAQNYGRRFYGCPQKWSNCRFIDWYDPPMCARAVDIIPGLLRSKYLLEKKVKEAKSEASMFRILLICIWVSFAVYAKWTLKWKN